MGALPKLTEFDIASNENSAVGTGRELTKLKTGLATAGIAGKWFSQKGWKSFAQTTEEIGGIHNSLPFRLNFQEL